MASGRGWCGRFLLRFQGALVKVVNFCKGKSAFILSDSQKIFIEDDVSEEKKNPDAS